MNLVSLPAEVLANGPVAGAESLLVPLVPLVVAVLTWALWARRFRR